MKRRTAYLILALLPVCCLYFGLFLNNMVLIRNNNQMPVYMPGGCEPGLLAHPDNEVAEIFGVSVKVDRIHVCMTKDSKVKWLADWIYWHDDHEENIMSPGNLFLFFYDWAAEKFMVLLVALVLVDFRVIKLFPPEEGPQR